MRVDGTSTRSIYGVADQAVYAATNLLLSLSVARQIGPADFGRFAAIYLGVAWILSLSRGWWAQPTLYEDVYAAGAPPLRSSLRAAVPLAGLLVAIAMALTSPTGAVIAAAVPVIALQDIVRYRFFSSQRPRTSLVVDCVWLATQCAVLASAEIMNLAGGSPPAVAWALGGAVSCGVGALLGRLRYGSVPRVAGSLRDDVRRAFALDACLQLARNQLLFGLFAIYVGWAGAGGMRLAVTMFGFVPVIVSGLVATALPDAARVNVRGGGEISAMTRRLHGVSLAFSWPGIVGVLSLASTGVLAGIVGPDNWAATRPVLAGIAVTYLLHALEAPILVMVYGFCGAPYGVRTKVVAACAQVLVTAVGLAIFRSAAAGAYAMAIGSVASLGVWWYRWRQSPLLRERVAEYG